MKFAVRVRDLINYLAVLIIFSDALSYANILAFELRAAYLIMLLSFILLLPFIRKIFIPKIAMLWLCLLIFFSLINIWLGNENIFQIKIPGVD